MPQVPVQSVQTVFGQPAGNDYENVQANPDAFGAGVARGLGAAANDANTVALDLQKNINETAVNDADANQFSPAVRDIRNKYLALQGKDAIDALPQAQADIQALRNQTRQNLASPKQQEMFDAISRKRVEIELDGMSRYGDQQQKVYEEKTFRSGLDNATNQAADNYNDEARFGYSQGTAQQLIDSYGSTHGWSVEQMKAEEDKWLSTANTQRVQRWAQDDPMKAQDYYQSHTSEFEAAVRPNIEKLLKNSVDPILQRQTADAITSGLTAGNAATPDARAALHAAVQYTESHNDPAAVSSAGAEGTMQVLPTTQANPGFGVVPAANKSPAELKRVGDDYLDAMLTRYGGNQTAAVAAYNWGPGNVDKLIASGVVPGSPQFIAALPKETQDYAAKINAKVPPADAAPPTTMDVKLQLPTWIAQAKATAEAMRPGDTVFADGMVTRVVQKANIIEQGTRATQDNARDQLVQGIVGMKNADGGTLDDLMAQPGMTAAWNAATPETRMAIQNKFKGNGTSEPPRTADSVALMYTKLGQAVSPDPGVREAFAKEDLMPLYPKMPYADWHQVMAAQKSINQGLDKDAAKQVNLDQALTVADRQVLSTIKLDGPSVKGNTDKMAARNQFIGRFDDALNQFAENNKKQPSQTDIRNIAMGLTATVSLPGRVFGTNDTQAFKLTPDQEATATVKLPDAERQKIISDFSSPNRYGRQPTESEIQAAALGSRLHSQDAAYWSQFDQAARAKSASLKSTTSTALRGAQ